MNSESRYASRKFIFCVAAFLAGLGLFIANQMTSEQWIVFTQCVVGMYLAANVIQKVKP